MITCTLGAQKYTVDFVSGRALREMGPAAKMYARIVALSNAALMAVQTQTTEILDEFPTKAARAAATAPQSPAAT